MSDVVTVGMWAAAFTAIVIAVNHMWRLFVAAVRTAVHDEMGRFRSELNSYDEFWTERLDRLERAVQTLEDRSKQLFDMVNEPGSADA